MANGPANPKKGNVNIKDLKKLIDLMRKAELTEVDIEQEGLKIKLRKGSEPQVAFSAPPQAQQAAAPAVHAPQAAPPPVVHAAPAPPAVEVQAPRTGLTITAPMVGTFYSASTPDTPPFIQEGDKVEIGKTVCIIEAMKLMNEIKAEISGRVSKVMVENAQPVEYGQPLFIVEPS